MPELKYYAQTASNLQKLEIPEINWVIRDFIPEGLSLFAGRPKIGKSYMALNLAFSIANGLPALSRFETIKSSVLYIAYEDNERRMQERIDRLTQVNDLTEAPDNLHLIISSKHHFPKLNADGLELIDSFLKEDLTIKCVIIDTFGSAIKADSKRNGNSFQQDYELVNSIQEIAMQNQVAIILLHHTRKFESEDPYEDIVGTTGITASPDTLLVLKKNAESNLFLLSVTGRDVMDTKLSLDFDKESCLWIAKDDLPEYHTTKERRQIIDLFSNDSALVLKSGDIADKIGKKGAVTSRLLSKLVKGEILLNDGYGSYRLNKPIKEEIKADETIISTTENINTEKPSGKIKLNWESMYKR